MNKKKAQALAAEYGASIDFDNMAHPYLDARPGFCFPSNTTHGVNLITFTEAELRFWLSDMERCTTNDCDYCDDWRAEQHHIQLVN